MTFPAIIHKLIISGYRLHKSDIQYTIYLSAFIRRYKIRSGVIPVSEDNEIMTISQVAKYLQISEITTYRLVQEGKIPAFKVGRSWRIKREDINEFIEKQKIGERF